MRTPPQRIMSSLSLSFIEDDEDHACCMTGNPAHLRELTEEILSVLEHGFDFSQGQLCRST